MAAEQHLALAGELARRGDATGAVAEARSARAVAPLLASVQAEAAAHLESLGATADAADARRRAFQLAPRAALHAATYAAAAAERGWLEELDIALDAVRAVAQEPVGRADLAAVVPAVAERLSRSSWSGPGGTSSRWARARLWAVVEDERARGEMRELSSAAPPIGPLAAIELGRAVVDAEPDVALAALRPWVTRLGPESIDDRDEVPTSIGGLALSAADRVGDHAAAIDALQLLVRLQPSDVTRRALLAERLAAAGRGGEAAAELATVAEAELAGDNLDSAAALFAAAASMAGADPSVLRRAAELALRRGHRDESRRIQLELAARSEPDRVTALLAAAELSPWAGRIELLRRAVEAAPGDPEPRRRLVQALVAGGQAVAAAAEAAALAELLQASADSAGALAAIEQARRLDPWNPGLQALRDALAAPADAQ
jgi:tetratricopeptide (TPR) repeat protein